MQPKQILVIDKISKSFGSKQILKDVCFNFESNKMYAILGKSGGGKTTLLNILGLIDNNYEGTIEFNGEKIINKKDYAEFRAKKIGFIFQSYYLIDSLNVEENILLPLKYSNNVFDKEYFDELVDVLKIGHILHERVNYLSGGEKQRIAIARSLINKPKLIICDEPTGNLDEENSNNVIELLKKFINEDRTIIVVTHSKQVAQKCTNCIVLKDGKLYE